MPEASSPIMNPKEGEFLVIFFIVKYILGGVTGQVKGIHGIIMGLDNRIKTMNNDIIKIDTLVNDVLDLEPDTDRIARADGKIDARKD